MNAGSGTPYAVASPSPTPGPVGSAWAHRYRCGSKQSELHLCPSAVHRLQQQQRLRQYQRLPDRHLVRALMAATAGPLWLVLPAVLSGTARTARTTILEELNLHDQAVAVDPNNPDRVFIDTFDVWFATRTGTTFNDSCCGYSYSGNAGPVPYQQHALAFLPGSSSILAIGNDGGIHGTMNADVASSTVDRTWFNMDTGLNTIKFSFGDISGNFANAAAPMAVGGAQDDGSGSVTFAGASDRPCAMAVGTWWRRVLGANRSQVRELHAGTRHRHRLSGAGTIGQQFLVGTQTFTWVMTRGGAGQVSVGTSANTAATNIRTAINADIPSQVTAGGNGSNVVVTAVVCGSTGNSIPFSNINSANLTFNGSGTLRASGRVTMLEASASGKATTAGESAGASIIAQIRAFLGKQQGKLDATVVIHPAQ